MKDIDKEFSENEHFKSIITPMLNDTESLPVVEEFFVKMEEIVKKVCDKKRTAQQAAVSFDVSFKKFKTKLPPKCNEAKSKPELHTDLKKIFTRNIEKVKEFDIESDTGSKKSVRWADLEA